MKPTTLYHCSVFDQGPELTVRRWTPHEPAKGEPDTPRLCVSPTIPQCLSARLFRNDVYVYRTMKKTKGVTPRDVWDSQLTGERWLLPGHRLERFSHINKSTVLDMNQNVIRWFKKTGESANARIRMAMLWSACVSLPEYTPKWLLRWVDDCLAYLNVDPITLDYVQREQSE